MDCPFVMIPRCEFELEQYRNEPASKSQALHDLYYLAAFADHEVECNGVKCMIRKGQLWTTLRRLADRWNWSTFKVSAFLHSLETLGRLALDSDGTMGRGGSTLTLYKAIDAETLQEISTQNQTQTKHKPNTEQTQTKRKPNANQTSIINKKEEEKKEEELLGAPLFPETPENLSFSNLPEVLNTERFKEAWCRWKLWHSESALMLPPSTEDAQLRKLADWGEDKAVRAIENSLGNNWRGLFDPDQKAGASFRNENSNIIRSFNASVETERF
jgi:hypothetical protein